jgi:hypothetical protein
MPISVQVYSALLSSPGGIEEDRKAAHRAVEEVNRFLRPDGLSVEIRDWQRDVRPTVGADGQDVVNNQICKDCDLAIVLIHDRVGSPTPRSPSGTMEEAEIVLSRREAGERVDLMAFFKSPSVKLSEESISSLSKVLSFRTSLEGRGVFWKEYSDSSDLESLIRIHLPNSVRGLAQGASGQKNVSGDTSLDPEVSNILPALEDDMGALDYEIAYGEALESMKNALAEITTANDALSSNMNSATVNLIPLTAANHRDPISIREGINTVSSALSEYNVVLRTQTPSFEISIPQMCSALIGLVSLSDHELRGNEGDLVELRSTIEDMIVNITAAATEFQSQREALAELPRLTSKMNAAKREGVRQMDLLSDIWRRLVVELTEVIGAIDARLGR